VQESIAALILISPAPGWWLCCTVGLKALPHYALLLLSHCPGHCLPEERYGDVLGT